MPCHRADLIIPLIKLLCSVIHSLRDRDVSPIHFTMRTLYHIDNIICYPGHKILNVDGFSTVRVTKRQDILGILAINTGFWVYYIELQDVDMLFQVCPLYFFSCFKVNNLKSIPVTSVLG